MSKNEKQNKKKQNWIRIKLKLKCQTKKLNQIKIEI